MKMEPIVTQRLQLIPLQTAHVVAFSESREALAKKIGARVPESFPVFAESMASWQAPGAPLPDTLEGWGPYLMVLAAESVLVGDLGYKGLPDSDGHVEIGYAVVNEYRRKGIATEAAAALVQRAFSFPNVFSVGAHTLRSGEASIAVLRKLGFVFSREIEDTDDGALIEWRLSKH